MFLLGCLAFLQMVFIPGFILLKALKLKTTSKVQAVVYIFALSLTANYLAVFLLTTLNIYLPGVLYFLILAELAFLVFYMISSGFNFKIQISTGDYYRKLREYIAGNSFSYNLFLMLALVTAAVYLYYFISYLGSTFKGWDVVLGWNRFALDWARNRLPIRTWHYPQLLPANWSVSYVLMQNTQVNVFAKAIMPLFSLFSILLFLDLGARKKQGVYFVSAVIYGLLIRYFYLPANITSGYADIPVAFFSFLAFYTLHQQEAHTVNKQNLLLSVLFASAAAVTKQAGIIVLLYILVWCIIRLIKNRKNAGVDFRRTIAAMLLIVLVVGGSWYIYKEIQIRLKLERSEINTVTKAAHKGRTYPERLVNAFKLLYQYKKGLTGKSVLIIPILLLFALLHRRSRPVTAWLVIPYTLMWALLYSYDHRNLTVIFPFAAFSMSFGALYLAENFLPGLEKLTPFKMDWRYIAAAIVVLAVLFNFTLLDSKSMEENQLKQELLEDQALERLVYENYEVYRLKGKFLTSYLDFKNHPLLKFYARPHREHLTMKEYKKHLANPAIRYMLLHTRRVDNDVRKDIEKNLKKGVYKRLFFYRNIWRFVRVK